MASNSKELLYKALRALADKYAEEDDCFFVVISKDGKNPMKEVTDQVIIGEMNVKTLVAFMVEAINQVCTSVEIDPHIFMARFVTGALLEQEKSMFHGFGLEFDDDFEEELEEEDEDEQVLGGVFILDPKMTNSVN
jgi:hypothetical protein